MPGDGGDVKGRQGSVPDLLDVGPAVQQRCQQLRVVLREAHAEPVSPARGVPSVTAARRARTKRDPGAEGAAEGGLSGTTSLSFAM